MPEQIHVRFKGPHLLTTGETIPPGSVVAFDENVAEELVKYGMATFSDGPAHKAPPPNHPYGTKADGTPMAKPWVFGALAAAKEEEEEPTPVLAAAAPVERADLGARLAQAEKAVARPQT